MTVAAGLRLTVPSDPEISIPNGPWIPAVATVFAASAVTHRAVTA